MHPVPYRFRWAKILRRFLPANPSQTVLLVAAVCLSACFRRNWLALPGCKIPDAIDPLSLVAEHIKNRRPKPVPDLLNPIAIPIWDICRAGRRIKPAEVIVGIEWRPRLDKTRVSLKQLHDFRDHWLHGPAVGLFLRLGPWKLGELSAIIG